MVYIPKNDRDRYVDSNDPNRCSWNRELEQNLPDSRLRGSRRRSTTIAYRDAERGVDLLIERVFCANCGCDGGGVTAEWAPHVFYVCDPCSKLPHVARQLCTAAGVIEVPDGVARGPE